MALCANATALGELRPEVWIPLEADERGPKGGRVAGRDEESSLADEVAQPIRGSGDDWRSSCHSLQCGQPEALPPRGDDEDVRGAEQLGDVVTQAEPLHLGVRWGVGADAGDAEAGARWEGGAEDVEALLRLAPPDGEQTTPTSPWRAESAEIHAILDDLDVVSVAVPGRGFAHGQRDRRPRADVAAHGVRGGRFVPIDVVFVRNVRLAREARGQPAPEVPGEEVGVNDVGGAGGPDEAGKGRGGGSPRAALAEREV